MKKITSLFITLFFIFSQYSCTPTKVDEALIKKEIQTVKDKYIPKIGGVLIDVSYNITEKNIELTGATTNVEAKNELIEKLKALSILPIQDKILTLPDSNLGDKIYGVINVSVADIRNLNKFTSGMATQSILGTPVKIYQQDEWYRIQTPDSYFGWIPARQVAPMNKEEYNTWITTPKIIFTEYYGFAHTTANEKSTTVSDLVAGNLLKLEGTDGKFYKVSYPDGRKGYVLKSQAEDYTTWLTSRKPSGKSFVTMAKDMMGIPYVWGGKSTKGMDCSGLVANVLMLHGLTIVRDASQQAYTGEAVDISKGYDNLQVGDMMFFGKEAKEDKRESIRHVGFYLGNLKFIHESGWTRIGSLDSKSEDYDEVNTKEFIRARRITNATIGKEGLWETKKNSFYEPQK